MVGGGEASIKWEFDENHPVVLYQYLIYYKIVFLDGFCNKLNKMGRQTLQ
jgi:hypothetical protein